MFSVYYTRKGEQAIINGISDYFQFGPVTLYSGNVENQEVTWDEKGRYKMNQLFGDKLSHDLDLVNFENEVVINPGVYYMELRK